MFYGDLRPIVMFFKLFGLLPLQNIRGKSDRLKVCALSLHTLCCVTIKASILLIYFLMSRHTFSTSHFTLLIGTFLNEFLQLKFFKEFITFINQVEKFDSMVRNFLIPSNRKKYVWFCVVVGVTVFNISIRLLFKQIINWKSILKKVLFIVIIFPSIMVPMSFIIICDNLTQRLRQLKMICRDVEEQLIPTYVFPVHKSKNYRSLENIRLAYVQLCKASEKHIRLFDFPMAFYFLAFFLEAFYYCYLITVLNEELHLYHLLRFVYNCCTIYAVTSLTDNLRCEVSLTSACY